MTDIIQFYQPRESDVRAFANELGLKPPLSLTLNKEWFDIMVTGEKVHEFRRPSEWIKSRLYTPEGKAKEYDLVKFVNGYGKKSPYFICEYKGFQFAKWDHDVMYGEKKVNVLKGDVVIKLGQIIKIGNI